MPSISINYEETHEGGLEVCAYFPNETAEPKEPTERTESPDVDTNISSESDDTHGVNGNSENNGSIESNESSGSSISHSQIFEISTPDSFQACSIATSKYKPTHSHQTHHSHRIPRNPNHPSILAKMKHAASRVKLLIRPPYNNNSLSPTVKRGDSLSTCKLSLSSSLSSVSASTCDFDQNVSFDMENIQYASLASSSHHLQHSNNPHQFHQGQYSRAMAVNPWAAAARGDYATLLHIVKSTKLDYTNPTNPTSSYCLSNDDSNSNNHSNGTNNMNSTIWTTRDEFGNIPLYYACQSGGAFGKYGLESIKLLIDAYPGGARAIPKSLIERCVECAVNRSVVHILMGGLSGSSGSSGISGMSGLSTLENDETSPNSLNEESTSPSFSPMAAKVQVGNENEFDVIPCLYSSSGENSSSDDDCVLVEGLTFVASEIGDDGFVEDY